MIRKINENKQIKKQTKKAQFNCPSCGQRVEMNEGKETCPSCNALLEAHIQGSSLNLSVVNESTDPEVKKYIKKLTDFDYDNDEYWIELCGDELPFPSDAAYISTGEVGDLDRSGVYEGDGDVDELAEKISDLIDDIAQEVAGYDASASGRYKGCVVFATTEEGISALAFSAKDFDKIFR